MTIQIPRMVLRLSIAAMAVAGLSLPAAAAEYEVKQVEAPPPEVVAEPIRELLQDKALQLLADGEPSYTFWMVKELPLKSTPDAPEDALDSIAEQTILGAVVAHEEHGDYRDDTVYKGAYIMRFALQPMDGNHLGTSEFPFFALLVPADKDTELDTFGDTDAMVEASSEDTAAEHPMILLLRPIEDPDVETPAVNEPVTHEKSIKVKLTGKSDDGEATVPFHLVFYGYGEV